jgi:hypothetical protein
MNLRVLAATELFITSWIPVCFVESKTERKKEKHWQKAACNLA